MKRSVEKIVLQNVVNPTNGEKSQRLVAKTSLGEAIRIWLRDKTIEEVIEDLKSDVAAVKNKLCYYTGEYGAYYSISGAQDVEEWG